MARSFNGSNQYLSTASSPVSGAPMTIACWMNVAGGGAKAAVSVGQATATHRNQLWEQSDRVNCTSVGPLASVNLEGSDTTSMVDVWVHGCAVFTSSASRTVYRNGASNGTNTTDVGSQNTADSIAVGARSNGSFGLIFNGLLAEVGVWSVALTAAEIASLADGMTCDKVRPQSLVFYAPLVRDIQDVRGGLTITNNNTATVAVHPRVYS
jgi:hypothetical protein